MPSPAPAVAIVVTAAVALCLPAQAHAAQAGASEAKVVKLAKRLFVASGASRTTRGGPIVRRQGRTIDAIVITRDSTLPEVGRAFPRLVRQVKPGVWEVRRDLFVVHSARLLISAPQVREVRLLSTPRRFVSIVARNAHLRFRGQRGRRLLVHSWDPKAQGVDRRFLDGRSSVAARRRSRLTIADTSFEYLGFYEGTVSGVATRSEPGRESTGDVRRSRFAHNYFGAYTFQSRDMKWIGNEFVSNHIYGFDPHDDSDGFLVERNYAAHNGRHGIIFSRLCDDNVIRDNLVENNGWHGIVLDDGKAADGPSDRNLIAGNIVRNNRRVGISIDGSGSNVVRDNVVSGSRYGVRIIRDSQDNVVRDNSIARSSDYGVFVDGQPRFGTIAGRTVIQDNRITGAQTGVRLRNTVDTVVSDNAISSMRQHGLKVDGTADRNTDIVGNDIAGRGPSPILLYDRIAGTVETERNEARWNYPFAHDLARVMGWMIGPGLWAVLLLLVLFGPPLVRRATGSLPDRSHA